MTIVSKISFAFVFLLAALHLKAQHYVSVSFEQTPFGKCIEEFEKQTSLTFYYDKADTDSIRVTLTAKAALLEEVLDQILKPENLEFSLYNNQVFISKGRKILTFISAAPTEVNQKNTEFDYSEFLQRDDFQKKAEDKLYVIGYKSKSSGPSARIIGSVKDQKTGESLVGASIFVKKGAGASTDPFGNFSLVLPIGRHKLNIQSVGMKSTFRNIQLYSDGSLSIEMTEDVISLKEVSVNASRENKVADVRMGVDKLDIKTVRQLPFSLGETDVLKAILVLPGVQTVGEGTLGFNVRGGNSSQNLILYNDAVIYNPSHLFGFFSTFNADMIKSVELLKSGIPAEYGGRLSSVLEVVSREGNLKKFSGAGGISPVTARLTLETPIIKDKSSLLVGFRTTYSDWILKRLESSTFRNSSGSFYDLAINYSHKINDKNNLALSGYSSQDQFKLRSDTSFQYKNLNYSAKWKSILSPKLFAVFTGAYSQYDFSINSDASPVNAFTLNYSIKQIQGKADFNYSLNSKHTISYGLSVIRYAITPGNLLPKGNESLIVPDRLPQEQALESAGYIGDNIEVNPRLTVNAGLRYSLYQYLGPRDVYVYDAG
ncbi:MAG: TonB-dependent receptor, partial [Cyclobacteriaceae bacterium]|nr:TonB-dependent receptor [Cyclobacteriaceae bacterium]